MKLNSYFVGGGRYSVAGRAHFCALSIDNLFSLRGGIFSRNKQINDQSYDFYNISQSSLFSSFDSLLEHVSKDVENNVLHILTDTPSHSHLVIRALRRGCNVVSEKPLCCSLNEFEQIKDALNKSNGKLFVTFNYNGYPMVRQIKDFVRNGLIGDISYIKSTMSQQTFMRCSSSNNFVKPQLWRQFDAENSMLHLDLFSHQFEMTRYVTGLKPTSVAEFSHSLSPYLSCIDLSQINIVYNDLIPGFFSFDKVSLGSENGLTWSICGTLGSLHWKQEEPEKIEFNNQFGEKTIYTRQSPTCSIASQERYSRFKPGHPAGYIEAFANIYKDIHESIVNNIINNDLTPIIEIEDFYKTLRAGKTSMALSSNYARLN